MSDVQFAAAGSDYLDTAFVAKGVGGWRALYLRFIEALKPDCVMEVGSGTPDFLSGVNARRRVAVDIGERFAGDFKRLGIDFRRRDLETDDLSDIAEVDIAICSDVFEHLLHPLAALERLAKSLSPSGALLSHVPNEFQLGHLMRVGFGSAKASAFHESASEWNDPHIRRFTPPGYRQFLERCFPLNLSLTDMRYSSAARALHAAGIAVPFCLQGGPTFVSTKDPNTFERFVALKKELSKM